MNAVFPMPDADGTEAERKVLNGLSVDLQDWFQVGAFESVIEKDDWASLTDRVERNVCEILDLFDEAQVNATFFAPGRVAKRHGGLMREIVVRGHELASHGWDHAGVFRMNRAQFREDILRARKVLEDASGVVVTGYRAPGFSIDRRTPWAFQELAEQGYVYSSSVAPVTHENYGWADAPRFAFRPLPWSSLVEIPVTTALFAGRRLTAGGGGMFRVNPYAFSRWAVRKVNRREGRPAVFYFHPWEIDPGQPRAAGAPLRSRLKRYANLDRMAPKLRQFVAEFIWGRMDVLAHRESVRLDAEGVDESASCAHMVELVQRSRSADRRDAHLAPSTVAGTQIHELSIGVAGVTRDCPITGLGYTGDQDMVNKSLPNRLPEA